MRSLPAQALWPRQLNEHLLRAGGVWGFGDPPRPLQDADLFDKIHRNTGVRMDPAPKALIGATWIYCLIWFLISARHFSTNEGYSLTRIPSQWML